MAGSRACLRDRPAYAHLLACVRSLLGAPLAWDRSSVNWLELVDLAHLEGVAEIVARVAPADCPHWVVKPLHENFARSQSLLRELQRVQAALEQAGVVSLALKGAALLKTVYAGDVGLRLLNDLDLLVRPADLGQARASLEALGYQRCPDIDLHTYRKDRLLVDVHTGLAEEWRTPTIRRAFRFDLGALFDRSRAGILDPCDRLLHLAVHQLRHSHSRLLWLVDVALVYPQVNAETLLTRAAATGTSRALAYALLLAHDLLGLPLEPAIRAALPRLSALERWYLGRAARRFWHKGFGKLMVACSVPGCRARVSYLAEVMFPAPELMERFEPDTPRLLRYPLRVVRLAGHLGRLLLALAADRAGEAE